LSVTDFGEAILTAFPPRGGRWPEGPDEGGAAKKAEWTRGGRMDWTSNSNGLAFVLPLIRPLRGLSSPARGEDRLRHPKIRDDRPLEDRNVAPPSRPWKTAVHS